MIKHYLQILRRNAAKKPVYTFVNLTGLAVGIACFVFIAIYIWDELGYDHHHEKKDRIYRVSQTTTYDGDESLSATTPFPLRDAILNDLPANVKEAARLFDMETPNISIGKRDEEIFYREENFFFSDPSVFKIFDIPLQRGDPAAVLSEPNSVIITPEVSARYFGDEDPIGRQLLYEGRINLTVTGIMEEWPRQSHFKADLLASFESLKDIWGNYEQITDRWLWSPNWTYILLEEGVDPGEFTEHLNEFSTRYYEPYYGENEQVSLDLQPLTNIYLHSEADNEIEPVSSYLYILIFSAVGLLILTIACINYINLSTSRALQRSKEVGLRKTLGAYRSQLTGQFLFESFVLTCLALCFSAIIVTAGMPYFNLLTGKEVALGEYGLWIIIAGILILIIFITLMAGFYPALFLSGYKPVDAVKGTFTAGVKGGRLRRSLVIFQFAVTAILLIGTSLTYLQYSHMKSMDMGFDRERVVVVPATMSTAIWYFDEMKDRILSHSEIRSVSGSKTVLGSDIYFTYQITPEGYGEQEAFSIAKLFVTKDFLETMDLKLLAGRTFSEEYSTDPAEALLVNKTMVDSMEWGTPEDAIGKTFRLAGKTGNVIGVTEDFHFAHLRHNLEPLIMELPESEQQFVGNIDYINIRLAEGYPDEALSHLQNIWNEFDATHPFEFFFLDRKIDEMYQQEQQFSSLMGIFTVLALLIGSLGLLGLASYSVSRRKREIGIRKAMGATATQIFYLLSKDYMILILIAHLIALPVAYLLADYGLESFPYRINLYWYLFVTFMASIGISILVSLFTISSYSIRAALLNPVHSLRQE